MVDKKDFQFLDERADDIWFLDSGASRHITFRRDWYTHFESCSGEQVVLGDDGLCEVMGPGIIRVRRFVDGQWRDGQVEDVLYVPNIRKNLMSVGVLTSRGFKAVFSQN